jgi:hypothetical protein
MCVLGIDHPLSTFFLILLLGTLLSYHMQIVDQGFHLLLSRFLVRLDVVNHHIDSLLGFLEFVVLGLLHILLDRLRCLNSQVVFNHIDVLVDLGNLFIRIDESKGKTA